MKNKLFKSILLSCGVLFALLAHAQPANGNAVNFVVSVGPSDAITPSPATFPGTVNIGFTLDVLNDNYTLSDDPSSIYFGYMQFSFTKLNPTGIPPTGNGGSLFTWSLSSTGGANPTYTWTGVPKAGGVTLTKAPFVDYDFRFSNVPTTTVSTVNNDVGAAAQWTDPGAGVANNSTNDNTASQYTKTNTVLPVVLKNFTASSNSCGNISANWEVASAVNFSAFQAEISTDGNTFNPVATIVYNPSQASYSLQKSNMPAGKYFIRLKMIDKDDKFAYSSIIEVKVNCDGNQGAFMMYPNPVLKGKQVILSSTTNESTTYRILDMAGKTVQEGRFTGNTSFQVNTGGAYIVDLQSTSSSTKYKLVVQ